MDIVIISYSRFDAEADKEVRVWTSISYELVVSYRLINQGLLKGYDERG